jgi:sortase (surface protein transpeptidase)
VPVAIRIPKAAVDASVERVEITDGVMQNPSGPWVVSWYHDLALLGRSDNVVMAGHVDYWDVGPAVFWNLGQLVPGDPIEVVSERDRQFTYAVAWMKNYVVADMTAADLDEMLGDAGGEALSLITCAIGSWDPDAQEYRERTVLRAMQI